jgi:hypothetical protein
MKHLFLIVVLFTGFLNSGYTASPEKYDWEEDRKKYPISVDDEKIPTIILKDKRVIEYFFDTPDKLMIYKTIHKIILVNTDEAIDQFNKVYVPVEDSKSIVILKARSISKNGKVTLLDKNSFKELQNLENAGSFKIFAIEGLEKGSEIEYIYTVKKEMSLFGREFLQASNPEKNVSLEIISPENLQFEAKSYNGLPQLKDTILNSKRYLSISLDSIPGAVEEEYSPYDANLKRVEYKLAYNHASSRSRILTWADAAEAIFKQTCVFSSTELSKVKKLCKSQKFYSLQDDESKIKAVENFLKLNYVIKKDNSAEFNLLDKIISNRYGSERGMVRLFEAIYTELNVDHRLVLTSDRSDYKFDGKFDSWIFLDNYLMYFPVSNKYLAPTAVEMRYGMVPFNWTHNEGLFIKRVKIGDAETSVSEVKFIPALPAESSIDNIYANIVFSPDFDNANINVTKKMSGYNAVYFQPYYLKLDAETKEKLHDDLMDFISKDAEVTNVQVENTDPNKSLVENPFIIKGDIKLSSLIEKAGSKYFFKLGDVIGRQSELYSDKKRVNVIENSYNRVYIRQIKVKIPQGYVFKNLDDININVAYEEDGQKTMGFISTYKIEGDMLIVDINEYYNKIEFPVSMYENFRKVINAAADFNKIILILDKAN